jgi:hypothetical protein
MDTANVLAMEIIITTYHANDDDDELEPESEVHTLPNGPLNRSCVTNLVQADANSDKKSWLSDAYSYCTAASQPMSNGCDVNDIRSDGCYLSDTKPFSIHLEI